MDWQAMWNSFLDGLMAFAVDLVMAALIFFGGWLLARVAAKLTKRAITKGKVDALAASFL